MVGTQLRPHSVYIQGPTNTCNCFNCWRTPHAIHRLGFIFLNRLRYWKFCNLPQWDITVKMTIPNHTLMPYIPHHNPLYSNYLYSHPHCWHSLLPPSHPYNHTDGHSTGQCSTPSLDRGLDYRRPASYSRSGRWVGWPSGPAGGWSGRRGSGVFDHWPSGCGYNPAGTYLVESLYRVVVKKVRG